MRNFKQVLKNLEAWKKVSFFFKKSLFHLFCFWTGIKLSSSDAQKLADLGLLRKWNQILYRIIFYPQIRLRRLSSSLRAFESYPLGSTGPGYEYLQWFRKLKQTDFQVISKPLTERQVAFVYALSTELKRLPPSDIFKLLTDKNKIDSWFSISKVLANGYRFEDFEDLFNQFSRQIGYSVEKNDQRTRRRYCSG